MNDKGKVRPTGRRNVLRSLGLGAGALTLAAMNPVHAGLLPKARKAEKYDVIVIGTGMSGMAAAMQARQDGASVLLIDKMPEGRSGGNTRLAGGLFAIPTEDTAESRKAYLEDMTKKAQGRGNVELYKAISERVRADVDWLRGMGVEFLPAFPFAPYRLSIVTAAPATYFGMPKALTTLRQKFTAAGGKIAFETKAKELIVGPNARVAGVKAVGPDGLVDYMSRAVVIAAGGYAGNREMMETFVDASAGGMMVRGVKHTTGDGMLMAHEAGAALINMSGVTAVHIAAVNPNEPAAGNPFLAVPFAIGINRAGKRFVDESKGYVAVGKATMGQPDQVAALVLGEETFKLGPPQGSAATFKKLNQPVIEANSIEELAAKIEVPPAELTATINAFNAAVQDGNKAPGASPPKATLAHKVLGPKYYAFYPLKPGVTLTFGGIYTNAKAQALEADGRPIGGLYASGEGAGGLYYDDYIGGASLANCLVMGRIAGAGAAAERKA
jgi:fumarate reductase flavoprotein subunit